MKNGNYKRKLAEVKRWIKDEKYASALAGIEEMLLHWPGSSPLLILRAELIQLQDEGGPPLQEARRSLEQAVEYDGDSIDACTELAHFQFAVEDNAAAADKSFAEAIEAGTTQLITALVGRAAALTDLGRSEEAFDCLARAQWLRCSKTKFRTELSRHDDLLNRFESLLSCR